MAFTYHPAGNATVNERTVAPYGLFFLSQHWYLAARDQQDATLKNFRLSRIASPRVNSEKPGSPDYEIPPTFRLRDHAQSRQAWELGDGESIDAVVEFKATTGTGTAALKLGTAIEGQPSQRRFQVRRRDAFVRWLMSLAGSAAPISPPNRPRNGAAR